MLNRIGWFRGLLLMTQAGFCQDRDVSGVVSDDKGRPLPGAYVYGIQHTPTYRKIHVETDENGAFKLANIGKVLFITARDLKPQTIIRAEEQSFLRIRLSPSLVKHAPQCPSGPEGGTRYGSLIQFLVPDKLRTRRSQHEPDHWALMVSAPKPDRKEQLVIQTFAGGGGSFIPEDWLLLASQFDQKDSIALDWKGKTQDGRNWRWFSSSMDVVSYRGVADRAAIFFDGIIDSACEKEFPQQSGRAKQ